MIIPATGEDGHDEAQGPHEPKEAAPARLGRAVYEQELFRLQAQLVTMQEWVRTSGARIVVIFEGRDAAGKGSAIKRVNQYLNPRIARLVALPAPTERQRGQGTSSATSSTYQRPARSC